MNMDRASDAFRRGHRDGFALSSRQAELPANPYQAGMFAFYDYAEGLQAGRNQAHPRDTTPRTAAEFIAAAARQAACAADFARLGRTRTAEHHAALAAKFTAAAEAFQAIDLAR